MPTERIQRQRTAMTRKRLSRPVQTAIESGVITRGRTVLDYGCGKGSDVRILSALGYKVSGFDPHFRPVPYSPADVVNLGYVLNVIEDRDARRVALLDAWENAKVALVVSFYLDGPKDNDRAVLGFGFVSKTSTFQWFPSESEAEQYLELWIAKPKRLARGIYVLERR